MMYLIENAVTLKPGVWSAKLPSQYLDQLEKQSPTVTPFSIVAAPITVHGNELIFRPDSAHVLGRGTTDEALFIDISKLPECSELASSLSPERPWRRDNDEGFYEACEKLVSPEFAALGRELVEGIRKLHPGRLIEGKSRKWLNQPVNFVALTIQNRDRSFAISIKNVSEAATSPLHPKPDRPGYLRFKVSDRADVPEALRLILASAARGS